MNKKTKKLKITEAVRRFWDTRQEQSARQGEGTGRHDQGARRDVTGGKQLDGFVSLVTELLVDAGVEARDIHTRQTTLPGFFRPTKEWDLLVVVDGALLVSIEFKSQVGPSFGNNFNNRAEEAVGSATDIWTAYREGAFSGSPRPWVGYFMLLEQSERSTTPVRVREPHFTVFEEFKDTSYAQRYEAFCMRLLRERMYDGACLLLSSREHGADGQYHEPRSEVSFERFTRSLLGHVAAFVD